VRLRTTDLRAEPHPDPCVEVLKEANDIAEGEVVAPAPDNGVQVLDHLMERRRSLASCERSHPDLEGAQGFWSWPKVPPDDAEAEELKALACLLFAGLGSVTCSPMSAST